MHLQLSEHQDEFEEKHEQKQNEEVTEHKNLNHNSLYFTFIQRYFTTYESDKQYLYMHSNGLFLIAAKVQAYASKPKQLRDTLQITQVKGKRKKGGLKVGKNTVIMQILCENGEIERIFCLVDGTVIEKNNSLTIQNLSKPEGYIAVIMPSRKFKPDPNTIREIPVPINN